MGSPEGELASVAGRSTNKVSELDTEDIRSGAEGTQLESFTFRSNNELIELIKIRIKNGSLDI